MELPNLAFNPCYAAQKRENTTRVKDFGRVGGRGCSQGQIQESFVWKPMTNGFTYHQSKYCTATTRSFAGGFSVGIYL